jgi:hypothetical protein
MKLVLISPKGPLYRHRGGIFKKSLRYAPLTLTTLAALVPPELADEIEIRLIDEGIEDVDLSLEADLVGMTVITGSAMRAYELAAHFRSRGIPVVLGGPHITLIPDDAAPHADAIVAGYAEDTWPELLRDFAAGRMKARYTQAPGLSLAGRPFPRRDMIQKSGYVTTHVFEATRGCVHSCDFCVVPFAWGVKPFQKPVEEIVADIRQHWAKKIIFIDLNLIADKEYAARLFEALIPLKLSWFGLSTTLLGRDGKLLALAARSGCSGLLMGLNGRGSTPTPRSPWCGASSVRVFRSRSGGWRTSATASTLTTCTTSTTATGSPASGRRCSGARRGRHEGHAGPSLHRPARRAAVHPDLADGAAATGGDRRAHPA